MKQQNPSHIENTTLPHATGEVAPGTGGKWFFVTALGFLALACLMLAGRPQFLQSPVLTGHGLSWLMLLLFGAGLPGVFGVVYWAIPKVFGVPLFSEKFVFLHFAFHYAGLALVLLGVVWPEFPRGEMGMTFIACGAIAAGVNLLGTFHQPAKPDVATAFIAASLLWLVVIALLGVPFATAAPLPVLEGTQWSAAWLLLALTGVLVNLPMGIALRVVPFALGAPVTRNAMAWYALAFSNFGLAWMFPATVWNLHGFLIFNTLVYGLGVGLFFVRFFGITQERATRELAWDGKILLTSFSLLPVAALGLVFSAWEHARMAAAAATEAAQNAGAVPAMEEVAEEGVKGPLPLEFLALDGALVLLVILGIALPAIVALGFALWRIEGAAAAKKSGGGEAHGLRLRLAEQVLLAAYFNYAAGALLVLPGAWLGIGDMLSLGSLFLLMGAVGFLIDAWLAGRAAKPDAERGQAASPETLLRGGGGKAAVSHA